MKTPNAAPAAIANVTFSRPIERGEQKIGSVQIREPNAGELRDLKMVDLAQLDSNSLFKLLPRITMPPLMQHEVEALKPADFFALATEVASFLLPEGMRPESPLT